MTPREPSPEQATASLSGCAHRIGAQELRRLLLEGATLVFDHEAPEQLPSGLHHYAVIEARDAQALIHELLSDREQLLVCLRKDWSPARDLAERLSSYGYHHVYTAENHLAGLFASDVSGVRDQL